ncbi:MAG: hypothetical protein KAR01_06965 [Desulfocapsa sp.]|nr:hypothetical protein [Desulfocapsa sp.]
MENKNSDTKPQKSMILLLLAIFFLFNGAQLFRTSINTTFFTEDISGDYSPIEATVLKFIPDPTERIGKSPHMIPVFSFLYKGEETVLEATDFAFAKDRELKQPFQLEKEYSLWVHKRWGKLMVPPLMGPAELGRSQLWLSGLFFLLAIGTWILRNKLAKPKAEPSP